MARTVELRRHTDSDGDDLTPEGVRTAVEIGRRLAGGYDLAVSSGAHRATQCLACLLAGLGQRLAGGATIESGFRSEMEDRWRVAAGRAEGGAIDALAAVDPELVELECPRLAAAVRRVLDWLPEGGRALVVGHSPLHEAAVYGLTGTAVAPLAKGAGVLVVADGGTYRVETAD